MTDKASIKKEVESRCQDRDGRKAISCSASLELATTLGVSPSQIGQVCNEEGIKIVGCQLGCFK